MSEPLQHRQDASSTPNVCLCGSDDTRANSIDVTELAEILRECGIPPRNPPGPAYGLFQVIPVEEQA